MKRLLRNMLEKDKILAANVLAAVIIKGIALIVSLLATPAYIRFFDNESVLGVWFTILSVLSWILTFDFGIGNGLRNHLVKALESNNKKDIKGYISSAFVSNGILTCALILISILIVRHIDLNWFFNVSHDMVSSDKLMLAIVITLIGVGMRFFMTTVNSIFYALQKSSVNNFLALIASVLLLGFVFIAPGKTAEDKLVSMAIGYAALSNIPTIVSAIILFSTKLRYAIPSVKHLSWPHTRDVLSIGILFFLCQILYMVLINTNEFFITRIFGPSNTVEYQIYYKLTSLVSVGLTLALTPLWSMVTKALHEKDFLWLQSIYRKLTWFALLATAMQFIMVPFMPFFIGIWVGDVIVIETRVSLVFALFGSVFVYQAIVSTIVCGLGKMKFQAISYTIAVIAKIVFIFCFAKKIGHWVVVVAINAVVLLPYCIIEDKRIRSNISVR